MALSTAYTGASRHVRVHLRDLQCREFIPERIIFLETPEFEIKIGRGSQTEANLHPQKSNAWFTSRVMSREHAILRADTQCKRLYLEDTGSMHGTYVEGARLDPGQPMLVRSNDKIQFGAEIVRGDQTYKPLQISLDIDWTDDYVKTPSRSHLASWLMSKNSFSADYSDEEESEHDDQVREEDEECDQDIRFVYEGVCKQSASLNRASQTFSVPDSDDSESSDVEKHGEGDSAPSSPTDLGDVVPKRMAVFLNTSTPQTLPNIASLAATPGSTLQSALNLDDDDEEEQEEGHQTSTAMMVELESDSDCDDADPDFLDHEDDESQLSDSEEEPDEEEEQAFNDTHLGLNPVEVLSTTEAHPRAPSPSDAAMPKPSWFSSTNLPPIPGIVEPTAQVALNTFGEPFIPGLPQQPGNHMMQFSCLPNISWSPNGGSSRAFHTCYDESFIEPAFCTQAYPPPLPRAFQYPWHARSVDHPKDPDVPCINTKSELTVKPSKVSINDIIDEVPSVVTACKNRKRKADEMSTVPSAEDEIAESNVQTEIPETSKSESVAEETSENFDISIDDLRVPAEPHALSEANTEKNSPNKKSVTFSPDAIIINSDVERPRKRAKLQQDKASSNFLKYFAATMAGATLGAVGTVFGLAALPADYFI